MQLFPNVLRGEPTQHRLVIDTPLGVIESLVLVDNQEAVSTNATQMYALQAGGIAARWELSQCNIELLLCQPVPIMVVRAYELDGYWAFLWRVQALKQIKHLQFVGALVPRNAWVIGGADSGEALDAQTWDDGKTSLTLGTEDGDALAGRATRNNWMPKQYLKTKHADVEWGLCFVEYITYGFNVNVGLVEANDQV